jgi:hypothetical protein
MNGRGQARQADSEPITVLNPKRTTRGRDAVKRYLKFLLWPLAPFILGLAFAGYLAWWFILRHYGEEKPDVLKVLRE